MSIGQAVSRLDGPAKVTGAARYAADTPMPDAAYAVIVPATRAKARITGFRPGGSIGRSRRDRHPHAPEHPEIWQDNSPLGRQNRGAPAGPRVHYEGQAVALMVADSLERATEAARLLQVFYSDAPFEADFLAASGGSGAGSLWHSAQPDQGQRSGSLVPGRREGRGHLSNRRSAPSRNRTRATLAVWQDGQLLVHDATQGVMDARTCLAQAVHLDPANVRVKCEFIGGGFGGKGWGWPYQILRRWRRGSSDARSSSC
jgi:xanthine dehydrogenase YagR molybdenum-binding subunit